MMHYLGGDAAFAQTAAAGTRIQTALGGLLGFLTNLANFTYTPSTTTHTVTAMRGQSRAKVSAPVAGGGTVVNTQAPLAKADGTAAVNNGLVGVLLDNGTWLLSTLSSPVLNSLSYTLNTAPAASRNIPQGNPIVYFGLAADAWHAAYVWAAALFTASTVYTATATGFDYAICRAAAIGEPIVLDSNNATVAGTLNSAFVGYTLN